MKAKTKFILISGITLILIFAIGFFTFDKIKSNENINQVADVLDFLEPQNNAPAIENKITTILFVGDIMLTRGVGNSVNKNFGADFNRLFENLPELKDADILFGNLEGDVSDEGNNVGSKYSFRMEPKVLPALKDAGFDILNFANNHSGDWNVKAFEDTLKGLNDSGISTIGADFNREEATTPAIIEKNGIKFGFLGFSDVGPNWLKVGENSSGILLAGDESLDEIIKNAKTKCDVLIVSFHFGEEYKLIHNARQETLAKMAIDNGADMIIGHHPHVMEDIEEYKGKPIVYSLGNFIFDQYFSEDTMKGMLFSATFNGKDLESTDKKIIKLSRKFQPEGIFAEE